MLVVLFLNGGENLTNGLDVLRLIWKTLLQLFYYLCCIHNVTFFNDVIDNFVYFALTKFLLFVVCGCKITHFLINTKHFARKSSKKVQISHFV